MRLVFLGNKKVVDQMASIVGKQIDNVKYDCFYSIEEFVQMTTVRSSRYDRMILISSLLDGVPNKSDRLYSLLEYLGNKLTEMRIVTLVRNIDEYNMYCRIFSAPLYVNIDVSNGLPTQLALSCVEYDIKELKEKYEREEDLGIKAIQQEIPKTELEQQPTKQQGKKKKKRNLFQRIFGLGTVEDVLDEQGVKTESVEQKPEMTDEEIEAMYENTQGVVNIVDTSNNSSSEPVIAPRDRVDIHIDLPPVQQEYQGVKYEDTGVASRREQQRNQEYHDTTTYQPSVSGYIPTNIDVNIRNNVLQSDTEQALNITAQPSNNVQANNNVQAHDEEVVFNMEGAKNDGASQNDARLEVNQASSSSVANTSTISAQTSVSNGMEVIETSRTFGTEDTVPRRTSDTEAIETSRTFGRRITENIDRATFGIDSDNSMFIDTTENRVETGVYSVEPQVQQEEINEGVDDLFGKSNKSSNIDTSGVENLNFNIDTNPTQFNVDDEQKEVKTGVQMAQRQNVDDDEDDFEASFVQREFSSRPSMTGSIGSLPSFDDTLLNTDEPEIQEVGEVAINPLDISTDDLFNTNDGPKVVEKIVTQVVEKPVEKIVEKEVVKEVVKEVPVDKEKIVFVGGGSVTGHSFKDIMSKKEPVFLVITGDRRSGVTTTALSLANLFSSKLKTLYVDFDIETRGSLLQLGIQNIIEEPGSIQEGIKNLRSTKVLPNIVHWGNNQFASLISLYGVEISDDELARTANTLAIQQDFNLVVIDCPIIKLGVLEDILPISDIILCIDGSAQGIKNTMSLLSDLDDKKIYGDYMITRKIQNIMYRSSRILLTNKVTNKQFEENRAFIDNIFNLQNEPIPWIKVPVFGNLYTIGKDIKRL